MMEKLDRRMKIKINPLKLSSKHMLRGGDNKGYDSSVFCKKWEIKKKTIFQYTKKVKDCCFFLGVRHGKHSN